MRSSARRGVETAGRSSIVLASVLAVLAAGCASKKPADAQRSAPHPTAGVLFDGTIQDLLPLHAGDRFVYRTSDPSGEEQLLTTRVAATEKPNEFVATVSKGDLVLTQMHLRDDGRRLTTLAELAPPRNAILVYGDPLPIATVPLLAEEQRFESSVKLMRLSDGQLIAEGKVEQSMSARLASEPEAKGQLVIRYERAMTLPSGTMRSVSEMWIEPGVGEMRSETTIAGAPSQHRELVCAVIAGKRVGECPSSMP
jgi:hypothetical protein